MVLGSENTLKNKKGAGYQQRLHLQIFFSWEKRLFIIFFSFFSFIFISWGLITLQYCSGFCRKLTWISHGFTCVPHPAAPSYLPLYLIPLGLPSARGLNLFQVSLIAQLCPTLCDPMDCSTPSLPVHHQLQELAQTHIHWVSDEARQLPNKKFQAASAFLVMNWHFTLSKMTACFRKMGLSVPFSCEYLRVC